MSKLASLTQLTDGWAGYESRKPGERSIKDAEAFARKIFNQPTVLEPIISPATDGEVNFFWEGQHLTLDLGFYGDGSYSFYAKTDEGEEFFGDNYSVDTDLPPEIIKHLKRA
jgi:hypothetical protein